MSTLDSTIVYIHFIKDAAQREDAIAHFAEHYMYQDKDYGKAYPIEYYRALLQGDSTHQWEVRK
jgi:hypothetical protein